jgi:hypothetical protein
VIRRLLVALLALAVLALPVAADAKHKHRSACQRLKAKHDLAPAHKVKLVERDNEDGGKDLIGCVLPKGKVRLVASSSDYYTSTDDYTVQQVKGAIVLVDASTSNQYVTAGGTSVFNIRTGKGYDVASHCYGFACGPPPGDSATHAFVNAKGQAAAAITAEGSDTITIAGFSSKGKRIDLDSGTKDEIPPSSLALDRHTVTWTHSGQPRSAQLSG